MSRPASTIDDRETTHRDSNGHDREISRMPTGFFRHLWSLNELLVAVAARSGCRVVHNLLDNAFRGFQRAVLPGKEDGRVLSGEMDASLHPS